MNIMSISIYTPIRSGLVVHAPRHPEVHRKITVPDSTAEYTCYSIRTSDPKTSYFCLTVAEYSAGFAPERPSPIAECNLPVIILYLVFLGIYIF